MQADTASNALEGALAATAELRATLIAQLEGVQAERDLLRQQAYPQLMLQAQARQRLNGRIACATASLQEAVGALSGDRKLTPGTVAVIAQHSPEAARALAPSYSEVVRLVRALKAADAINRRLLDRTLRIVRGFRAVLQPTPVAYNRRGLRPAFESSSTTSRRV